MINLGNTFANINTTLNGLLGKFTKLRFIGFDQENENARYYMTANIRKGWSREHQRNPRSGEVEERIRISSNSTIDNVINLASMLELSDDTNDFVRYTMKVLKTPEPPTMEWVLIVAPNREDKSIIT